MLVILEHPEGVIAALEYATALAEYMDGNTEIINPRTFEDYVAHVKAHKPSSKSHLILLSSHYTLGPKGDEVIWRIIELLVNNRGGQVWGVEPHRVNETYNGPLVDGDYASVAYTGSYNTERAKLTAKLGKSLLGRSLSDPHTLFVGFRYAPPRVSASGRLLMSSLPEEWWRGAAFIPVVSVAAIKRITDWFSETNVVALGDRADTQLTALGIQHGSAPQPPSSGLFNRQAIHAGYGRMLRETARLSVEDNRDWKP